MSDTAAEAGAVPESAGTLLRQAREAAGLHVASLAVSLKVPVRKLEALEEDRHEELPDLVFVRALASSVCRTLKIDPQPILERLPQGNRPRLVQDDEGINAPFRAPGDGPRPGWKDQATRPVALTVGALLLGALILVFLPVTRRDEAPATADAVMPPGTTTTVTSAPAEPRVVAEPPAVRPAPVAAATPAPAPVPAATIPTARPVAAAPAPTPAAMLPAASAVTPATAAAAARPAASAPVARPATATASAPASVAAAPAATASAAAAAAPPANGIVVFRTRGRSWVQVTDASGAAVLRRLMEPGESAGANGALPLTVTIGSAESTDVQVRGKPFNLGPVSRDNVARFEVK